MPRDSIVFEPATLRLFSFSAMPTSIFVARSAGAMPNTTPASTVTPAVNAKIRQSAGADVPTGAGRSDCPQRAINKAERSAHASQQQAFCQQLADEPPARRADRQPDGNLPLPRRCAREQKVRDVRADEQKHERDDAPMNLERSRLALVVVVGAAACRIDEQVRDGGPALVARSGCVRRLMPTRGNGVHAGARLMLEHRFEVAAAPARA